MWIMAQLAVTTGKGLMNLHPLDRSAGFCVTSRAEVGPFLDQQLLNGGRMGLMTRDASLALRHGLVRHPHPFSLVFMTLDAEIGNRFPEQLCYVGGMGSMADQTVINSRLV